MALTATVHNFDIELADSDRGVYESLALRVARHPSESEEYLIARVLAYTLEYTAGIEFSRGLSSPDEPAISVRDLTGGMRSWIEVGTPDEARLHERPRRRPAWSSIRTRIRLNSAPARRRANAPRAGDRAVCDRRGALESVVAWNAGWRSACPSTTESCMCRSARRH